MGWKASITVRIAIYFFSYVSVEKDIELGHNIVTILTQKPALRKELLYTI